VPRNKQLLCAILAIVACPIGAQDDDQSRYFSLVSNRTFGVGE